MYMSKYHYPKNFAYAQTFKKKSLHLEAGNTAYSLKNERFSGDIFRIEIDHSCWQDTPVPQSELSKPASSSDGKTKLEITADAELKWTDESGDILLQGKAGDTFGFNGKASLFKFCVAQDAMFYGMGEKCGNLEKSGIRTKFWNTDVWGDFPRSVHEANKADPMYVSVPWLIIKSNGSYVGLLLDNAFESFMFTTNDSKIEHHEIKSASSPSFP